MRLLFIPRLEDVGGANSLSIVACNFLRVVLSHDPTLVIYMAVHEEFVNLAWMDRYSVPAELRTRIIPIPVPEAVLGPPRARKIDYLIGSGLIFKIGPMSQCKFIDCVLTDAVCSIPSLKMGIEGTYSMGMKRDIPLVDWWHWAVYSKDMLS